MALHTDIGEGSPERQSRPSRVGRRNRRAPFGVLVLVLLAPAITVGAGHSAGAPVVIISWQGARLSAWENADGSPGRRFIDLCHRDGWVLRPEEVGAAGDALRRAATDAGALRWTGGRASPTGVLFLGPPSDPITLSWRGVDISADLAELPRETRVWLEGKDRLRWEEVVEILDLTPRENLAFRNVPEGDHPMARLREAFLRDKRTSSLAIYLMGTRRPASIAYRLDLTRVFEDQVRSPLQVELRRTPPVELPPSGPGSPSLERAGEDVREAARRRLFDLRILASEGRIYGRCDRILQSMAAEGPRGTVLVVASLESPEPFVAVYRVRRPLPVGARPDGFLEELL